MSFILEDGDFSVTSGNRTLFTTTRRSPHIFSKIITTIEVPKMTVYAAPRYSIDNATVIAYYFGVASGGIVHSYPTVSGFYSNSIGKFFVLPFFKATLSGDPNSSTNTGDTGSKWVYAPGGALLRVYGLPNSVPNISNKGAQAFNDFPTGYVGALTINVLLNAPGYEDKLVVQWRNKFLGCGDAPGWNAMFPPPYLTPNSSLTAYTANYTDASIECVIYLGRF